MRRSKPTGHGTSFVLPPVGICARAGAPSPRGGQATAPLSARPGDGLWIASLVCISVLKLRGGASDLRLSRGVIGNSRNRKQEQLVNETPCSSVSVPARPCRNRKHEQLVNDTAGASATSWRPSAAPGAFLNRSRKTGPGLFSALMQPRPETGLAVRSQQLGAVFGRGLAQDLLEHPVEMGERLEADFKGDFTHAQVGV